MDNAGIPDLFPCDDRGPAARTRPTAAGDASPSELKPYSTFTLEVIP